jgi:hypothetical protein
MKVLLGATAAVFLMASAPAFAQTQMPAACQNFPAAPTVIDGSTAEREAMEASQAAVVAWNTDMEARLEACRTALQAYYVEQDAARVAIFNQMAAETTEFNERAQASADRQRRRSVQR